MRWFALLVSMGFAAAAEPSVNSLGMKMVPIEAGKFRMGQGERQTNYLAPLTAAKDRGADWDELPVRQVEITHPFLMGMTEVTNAQYEQFDPAHKALRESKMVSSEDDAAVVNVSWEDAVRFCRWLSERENRPYRLPTEAEWEYACRAGTQTRYHLGDVLPDGFQQITRAGFPAMYHFLPDVKKMPSYYRLVPQASLRVAQRPPNAWGLQDMHGNAAEWCLDWYGPYDLESVKDPLGPASGESRVVRGGSHSQAARLLRSANRSSMFPWARVPTTGFRVVSGTEFPEPEKVARTKEESEASAAQESPYSANQPYFAGPESYVQIPAGSKGPLFSRHNHDPAIACLPNGDLLACWYTCEEEPGSELAVAFSRRHGGAWSPASLFFDVADCNDHAPVLFADGDMLYHFNGNKNLPGSIMRISRDGGRTWTAPVAISTQTQPNEATIKTRDGRLLATFDGPNETTLVRESRDGGQTWADLSVSEGVNLAPGGSGTAIAGIHAGMAELSDGRLMALGRLKPKSYEPFQLKMPMSLSTDGGKTWTYTASPFPAITSTQRPTMKRLREGPILFCSFTDRLSVQDEAGKTIGQRPLNERDGLMVADGKGGEIRGYGLYAALSWDDGTTWPVRRLITPGEPPCSVKGTDAKVFEMDAAHAEPNGYLAMSQGADGKIHLISSRNHYEFNLAWLTQGTPYAK